MAIMDIIKKRRQGGPAAVSAEDVATHQQAGATGKVGRSTGGPKMSNVGSQLAAQQGQAQLGAIQTQGMAQTQALGAAEKAQDAQFKLAGSQQDQKLAGQQAGLAAQTRITNSQRAAQEEMAVKQMTQQEKLQGAEMNQRYSDALHNLAAERGITEQQIFGEIARNRDQLSLDKKQSFLSQTAHVMAMSDKKYTDEIRRVGDMYNFKDQLNFKMESQRLAFGQDYALLNQQFNMQSLANTEQREFQEEMANMSLDTALALAGQAAKEQAYKSILTGMTGAVTAYSSYGGGESSPDNTAGYGAGQGTSAPTTSPIYTGNTGKLAGPT